MKAQTMKDVVLAIWSVNALVAAHNYINCSGTHWSDYLFRLVCAASFGVFVVLAVRAGRKQ